ncbi:hypothetical protein MP638_004777 [Amoeboaphelidium occidentale]|nr:hypothetical protein MP638_004777 [Amoeboaphelidium occidentale]
MNKIGIRLSSPIISGSLFEMQCFVPYSHIPSGILLNHLVQGQDWAYQLFLVKSISSSEDNEDVTPLENCQILENTHSYSEAIKQLGLHLKIQSKITLENVQEATDCGLRLMMTSQGVDDKCVVDCGTVKVHPAGTNINDIPAEDHQQDQQQYGSGFIDYGSNTQHLANISTLLDAANSSYESVYASNVAMVGAPHLYQPMKIAPLVMPVPFSATIPADNTSATSLSTNPPSTTKKQQKKKSTDDTTPCTKEKKRKSTPSTTKPRPPEIPHEELLQKIQQNKILWDQILNDPLLCNSLDHVLVQPETHRGFGASKGQFNIDGSVPVSEERKKWACLWCFLSGKYTPTLRKGPTGARTLCNSCGIWYGKHNSLPLSRFQEHLAKTSNPPKSTIATTD